MRNEKKDVWKERMKNTSTLKVAAFQFAASHRIADNLKAIERGVTKAADYGARLLVTQECAVCGYPPLEVKSIGQIDHLKQQQALSYLKELALKHNIYIAAGHISIVNQKTFNAVAMLSPDRCILPSYYKRALWGWDQKHFAKGDNHSGVYTIDDFKIGVRICYEVRFPEYFRELFRQKADLAVVAFADVGPDVPPGKYDVMQAHLVTRATENAMYILSANSLSQTQLAPTCLINQDGRLMAAAPCSEEYLLTGVIERGDSNFGRTGRVTHSCELLADYAKAELATAETKKK